ncbi:probable BOI-related E3 ubiquitin-protein ligase 2 [Solanum dulcamara]|uniref:probable BOI-related E3 ubiquitin-protein ligase 2 n=1 Tax=Solanum dulcamara TaxID=45834 RepID=UPI0024862AA9|nr:probable BOI-related E3 ubiquitin-protein ligase 2 [Solanum dulcamara]XP_055808394.1 probable BOI-related E3 ubiquitin-protein ligase 2 [Solanum dulcamara]XP_055808395.1 probable BOI-related E3 ubiquitin-protein ligase 2 [Solanum dulcamara]
MAIQAQLYSENLGFSLGSSQDLMDNNVCGFNQFCFNPQPQHQQQQQQPCLTQIQQQQLHILNQKNNSQNLMNTNYTQSLMFPHTLASLFEKQRVEIDHFISLQNERLRLALQEQRKQQVALILRNYESKIHLLLRQKDEEIAKACKRSKELEDFLKRVEMENQTWQRIANENEAIAVSLNKTIEQLRENACFQSTNVGDAESCCDVPSIEDKVQSSQQQETRNMMCKNCNSSKSCMVFLPCRHLSSCKDCDSFLHSCPLCNMVKKATIEALI